MKAPPSGRAGRAQATPDQGPSNYLPEHHTTVPTRATRIYTGPSKSARCANCGCWGRRHPVAVRTIVLGRYPYHRELHEPVYNEVAPWYCPRCRANDKAVV